MATTKDYIWGKYEPRVEKEIIEHGGGGGGGTTNYDLLTNKPSVNGKTLTGNQTAVALGLAQASDVQALRSELTNKLDTTALTGYYTKTEADTNLQNAVNTKADKATTYTKDEVDQIASKIVVPKAVSELSNDSNYQSNTQVLQTIADQVPTVLSGFTNDAGYQDKTQLDKAISDAIAGVSQFDYLEVTALPTTGVKGTIYILGTTDESGTTTYEQYLWVDKWIPMGAKVDLSSYAKTVDVQTLIDQAGHSHADVTKANEFTNVNDFKAITVHSAEYTPSQVQLLTGIDSYIFPRKCAVGETIDTGLPTAAIAAVEIADPTIFSADTTGTTATLTGLAAGNTVIGLRTVTGYLMQMNFYCLASHSATGKTYAKVQIDGIKNGDVLKAGQTYTISSIMYADTDEGRAALPKNDVADIWANNAQYGIDGCGIAYSSADWGNQTYTVNGVEYTGMSRCYFKLSNLKPGIYTLGGFYVGMDRGETNPVDTVDECLNTTTLTFAVTNSGKSTEFDKLDVEQKLVAHDTLVTRAKSDYYIATTFEMTGQSTYGATTNVMLATGAGDKKTYFNLVAVDTSLITVDEASKEFVTFDFVDKSFTYIKSTTDNSPLPVTISYNGAVMGTAYVNFTTAQTVQPTNINVTIGIVPKYTDAGLNTMIDSKIAANDVSVQQQFTAMQTDINGKTSVADVTQAIKTQVFNGAGTYIMPQLFNGGLEANTGTIHMLSTDSLMVSSVPTYGDVDKDYLLLTEKDMGVKVATQEKIAELDALIQQIKADYYTTHNFTLTGNTYGTATNIIMCTSLGDKRTYFNLTNDFDVSRITVSDSTYATWDFAGKYVTFITAPSGGIPHEVQIMIDGVAIGSAWLCFSSTGGVHETNISYSVYEKRL